MNAKLYVRGKTAFTMYEIALSNASEVQLSEISRELGLGLSVQEMQAAQAYFKREGKDVKLLPYHVS